MAHLTTEQLRAKTIAADDAVRARLFAQLTATFVCGHDVAARAVQLNREGAFIPAAVVRAADELGFRFAPGQEDSIVELAYRLSGNGPTPHDC